MRYLINRVEIDGREKSPGDKEKLQALEIEYARMFTLGATGLKPIFNADKLGYDRACVTVGVTYYRAVCASMKANMKG